MANEREALSQANDQFYRALDTLNLEAMESLWLHEGWVRCIHPGWDCLIGWQLVKASWKQIFASTRWLRVTPTAVDIAVFGELGVVACTENITAKNDGGDVGLAVAQATNLFQRTVDGWRLIHHHASPAPVQVTQPFSGTAQ